MAPRLIALLACQEIMSDDGRTVSLFGVVSSITMAKFPAPLEGHLFIRLAGLEGDHVVTLAICDVDRALIVGTSEWGVTGAVARDVQDFTVTIDMDVSEPATIQARILVDGELIGWSDVEITGAPEPVG